MVKQQLFDVKRNTCRRLPRDGGSRASRAPGRACTRCWARSGRWPTRPTQCLEAPRGELALRDLVWNYGPDGNGRPALDGIDFEVAAGERIALVGRVGSGKSTLLALLARLYPAPDGAIFLDGIDTNRICLADLRRAVAQVPQDAFLFSRPIDENIAYGRPAAAQAEIERAAAQARIDGEIAGFEQGYRTWVGERGVTLSGGQRQRMTLARALLVLDDATASVDAGTEREIMDELFVAPGAGRAARDADALHPADRDARQRDGRRDPRRPGDQALR